MKPIGGYFELELSKGEEYHKDAIKLNSARNALEYFLYLEKYDKILLPYFTCDVILNTIKKTKILFDFYHIDINFEPLFDFDSLRETDLFLYTNYLGLKDQFIKTIASKKINLVVDNAQSFFSKPIYGVSTFYSPRKFFGVPDGGYLYTNTRFNNSLPSANSFENINHLLLRIDTDVERGYKYFLQNEERIDTMSIGAMSNLTMSILKSIDYKNIAEKRRDNFNLLNSSLGKSNFFDLSIIGDQVPMVYPYYSENINMRQKLIENKIYTPKFWNNVLNCVQKNSIEYKFTEFIINLPIDQRYGDLEMDKILETINKIEKYE